MLTNQQKKGLGMYLPLLVGLGASALFACGIQSDESHIDEIASAKQAIGSPTCLASDAGKYCGNDMMSDADPNTLYQCPGKNMSPSSSTYCPAGCTVAPSGTNDHCASSPVTISYSDLSVFQNGNYATSGYAYLRWQGDAGKNGGSDLSATYKWHVGDNTQINDPFNSAGYAGQCVSMVRSLAVRGMPGTNSWQRGDNVMTSMSVPSGTIIATFSRAGGGYEGENCPCDHTGVLGGYTADGIILYEQNGNNDLLVGRRIRTTSANKYYTVLVP